MSDTTENNLPVQLPDPSTEVSVDAKVKMLMDWIGLVQKDIDIIQSVRDAEFEIYKKRKEKFDGFLAKRYKIVSRLDKRINERRRSITDIEREIANIQNRPAPGVLPPLEELPKKVRVKKKTETNVPDVVVEEIDVSKLNVDIQLTDEEKRQLTNSISNT